MKVLFLCTGNSCRSQMAEGWARALKSAEFEAFSAGTEEHGLNSSAVKVMKEAGVDIGSNRSKTMAEFGGAEIDYVVTVCDSARKNCPYFPGSGKVVHHSFDDPPALAKTAGSEQEALDHYRRVRDEIKAFVSSLPEALERE